MDYGRKMDTEEEPREERGYPPIEFELTYKHRTCLVEARGRCGCESYYRYQCSLCRLVGAGTHTEEFGQLRQAGFLKMGGYPPYELTEAGEVLLKRLRQDS